MGRTKPLSNLALHEVAHRTQNRHIFVQINTNGNLGQQFGLLPLVRESFHESWFLQTAANLWSDSTCQINATNRHRPQSEITRFSAISRNENIQSTYTEPTLAVQGSIG